MIHPTAFVHPLANVEDGAELGAHTQVWQFATVRSGAHIGEQCVIGQGAFVDTDVRIGDRCKIENYVSAHRGARVHDDVFLGPGVILTNDRWPRSTTPDGRLKTEADWRCEPVTIHRGASVGAGAILLPGITVGVETMIGAGAVVTRDPRPGAIVVGNPATELASCDAAGPIRRAPA